MCVYKFDGQEASELLDHPLHSSPQFKVESEIEHA